jgi:hypothetical protein
MIDRPALAERLDLRPHPEGGWYRETFRSPVSFTPDGYAGERAAATAIYFLLHPGERSAWHAVRSDELWFWHAGGPLSLHLGGAGEIPSASATVVLGPDLLAGQEPQAGGAGRRLAGGRARRRRAGPGELRRRPGLRRHRLPAARSVRSVISLGAKTRNGGPQKPVPRLVQSCVRSPCWLRPCSTGWSVRTR